MAAAAPALVAAVTAGVVAAHPAGTTTDGQRAPPAAETTTCPLRLGAQLRLGPRPADTGDATPVLGYALTVTNASSTATCTLSTWDLHPDVDRITPARLVRRVPSSRRIAGRPAPPSRDDVVTLGPGRTHRIDGWAWADGALPWTTAAGDESWTVVRDGAVTITLCLALRDHRAEFAAAGVPVAADVAFTTGRLCARPATVRYQTVSRD